MPDLPTGTVTFLFTDIEGSTALWEQHPEAARAALVRHDVLVEQIVAEHHGQVVRPRGEGDSRFAVFARATDAIAAAAALQQAFAVEAWPTPAPLRVRMALHTGEADLREGDYYGSAVNRCARLRAVAHGGQTLATLATQELVRDSLPASITLRDLGVHRLKDLSRREHIFQLVAPGVRSAFPPLATLERAPNNLPLQPTPLIGRDPEVEHVRQHLLDPEIRLVTLTGPGGTGKTRLALAAAAAVVEHFPDGVWFVDLGHLNDPAQVAPAIATVLSVKEHGGKRLAETLATYLRGRQLLLVLDNFEHVLSAAPLLEELLRGAPRLSVLVTSRVVLGMYGEQNMPVPPLALPDLDALPPLEALTRYEAIRLFVARAQAVRPDFALTPDTAPIVAEICRRLDGLPLAIELAAAQIRLLPAPALLARLRDRPERVLAGGSWSLPARQQTLRATLDWSYNLLNAQEQMLLRRLAVFAGSWMLEATAAVCNADNDLDIDVLDGLTALLDKSLVHSVDKGGKPRLSMLETIREYALEQLMASGEAERLRSSHARFYLRLVASARPELARGASQMAWHRHLDAEYDNLRAALQWLLDHQEVDAALEFAGGVWPFWMTRGYLSEGRRALDAVLALAGAHAAQHTPELSTLYLRVLRGAGWLASEQNDYERATALFEQALVLTREMRDTRRIAGVLVELGYVARLHGDYARAMALFEESVAIAPEAVGQRTHPLTLSNLGMLAHIQGDDTRALSNLEAALSLSRERGDNVAVAWTLAYLGQVLKDQGNAVRARTYVAEGLALFRGLGNRDGIAFALELLAGVLVLRGQALPAARLFGAADALREAIGSPLAPFDQPGYERDVERARSGLEDGAWQAAWAEGRAMTLEQVVAYALEQ